jgi:hypothetical protein
LGIGRRGLLNGTRFYHCREKHACNERKNETCIHGLSSFAQDRLRITKQNDHNRVYG